MFSKKSFLIGGIVLFFLILIFILYSKQQKFSKNIYDTQIKKSKTLENFSSEKQKILDNLTPTKFTKLYETQIIEKTLDWINSMKDQDYIYFSNVQCDNQKKCSVPVTDKQIGIAAMWAHYKYYKKSHNDDELNIVKSHINSYINKIFQPDFWHCRFLFEISNDSAFSQNDKNNLKKICENSTYYKFTFAAKHALNNLKFDSNYFINKIKNTAKSILSTEIIPINEQEALMYSTYASDFVTKYFLSNTPQDLFIAKNYFDASLTYYVSHKTEKNVYLPFLGLAAIDFYKATLDDNYLNFAKFISEYVGNKNIDNLSTKIILSYLKNELFIITQNKNFFDWSSTKTDLINNYFDSIGYNGYRLNKGCFHNRGTINFNYDLRNNSLIVGLLSLE